MFALDTSTLEWIPINSATSSPPERADHSAVLVGNKIVVFGGWNGRRCFNDLWVFDTESFSWIQPRAGGVPPTARHGHTMEFLVDGRIVIFGGHNLNEEGRSIALRDVCILDTETMVWSRPNVTGDSLPAGRYGHASLLVDTQMVIFGGWTGGELKQMDEKKAKKRRDLPKQCDFLWVFDTETMSWSNPVFSGKSASNRYGHSMTLIGNHIFVCGGWDGSKALNDVVDLQIVQWEE